MNTNVPNINREITIYEQMITKQLEVEVSNAIHDFVENHMNKVVQELAVEAVKNWAIQIQISKDFDGFNNQTNIQINFVENVVKTLMKENPISIKVNNKDKQ